MKRNTTSSNNLTISKDEKNIEETMMIKKSNKIKRTSKLLKINTSNLSQSKYNLNYKIQKDEEKEFVEIILGDFYDFHLINDIPNFSKMTSLSIVNDMVEDMGIIIENIPNKDAMIYLCLNENYIKEIQNIQYLKNLKQLHLNFNLIEKIDIGVSKINTLKQFWICDNKIKIIENIPENINDFWIANNLIENLPSDFDKYKKIETLNLAGNCLIDFNNIYILEKLNNLKVLYLNNCNFGENPICTFVNYRMMMIHLFKKIKILDQYNITFEEREENETAYMKKSIYYKNTIRDNKKLIKMINKLLKGHKIFFKAIKYHFIRLYSLKQKLLEYKLYEKDELESNNDFKITDIQKEIISLRAKIICCFKEIEFLEKSFKVIKEYISDLNDLSIVFNFYEIESYGNYKIEVGNTHSKWVKSCLELIKLKTSKNFLENNKFDMNFNRIYKIHNKKVKTIFDSLYDNLIDLNGKFGSEKNFYDFYFLVFPQEKLSYREIFHFLFEKQENEKEMILTDNLALIDNLYLNKNKSNKSLIAIICKCINFNSMLEEFKSEKKMNSINEIINEIKCLNSEKEIIKLNLTNEENTSFYYYNIQGAVEPIYIVEYEYIEKIKKNSEENIIIPGFDKVVHLSQEHEKNFELCCKELCNDGNKQFFSQEIINKYLFNHFLDLFELDNSIVFFAKNSILKFLNKSFIYKSFNEFQEDLKNINEEINEITFTEFNKIFTKSFFSTDEKEKINLTKIKKINLFNCEYSDLKLEELLNQINDLSKANSKILSFTKRIDKIILSKNNLNSINLGFICSLFPNLKEIDISHNHIKTITYEPKETTNSVNNIDISFNDINDFSYIILIFKHFNSLAFFKYFANPFDNFSEQKFCNSPSKFSIIKEEVNKIIDEYKKYICYKNSQNSPITVKSNSHNFEKEILNFIYLYDQFAYSDKYKNFKNNLNFREKFFYNSTLKTLNLSKNKLLSVPNVENGRDIQSLILNLNKIKMINNLEQFSNLIELYVQNNKISHFENPPKTLKKLDISNNEINNLKDISKLSALEWLNLENNLIEKLDEIEKLSQLIEINLSRNKIKDLKECIKLESLKQITIIDLYGNKVCDNNNELRINMIYNCPQLKIFNRIIVDINEKEKSIDYFKGKLTNNILEKRLGVNYNTRNIIELDLSCLKLKDQMNLFSKDFYPKLKKLNLSKNNFRSFSIFGDLPSLKELNFSYNYFKEALSKRDKIINRKGILGLQNLEKLEMSNNQLINLNGIQFLKNLKTLNLKENNFSNIQNLNDMSNLTYLNISNNKIEYLEKNSLGDLPLLQYFICDNNFIKNINGLSKFESIKVLSLENNKIVDLNCLEEISDLKHINELILKGNPISLNNYYRENLIRLIPSLRKIDGILIIEKERERNQYNTFQTNNFLINNENSIKKKINDNFIDTENSCLTLPQIITRNPDSTQNKRVFNSINDFPKKLTQRLVSNINTFKMLNDKK